MSRPTKRGMIFVAALLAVAVLVSFGPRLFFYAACSFTNCDL